MDGATTMTRRTMTREADVAPEQFREVMAHLVSGVCAVTLDVGGRPAGLTVSSVSSYSDSPPSLSFAVAHSSRSHDTLLASPAFGVHILAAGQAAAARVLAGRGDEKFAGLDWEWSDGVPRIRAALAFLRCRPAAAFLHGDHTTVIAEIDHAVLNAGVPLVYLHRRLDWTLRGVERDGPAA